LGATGWLLPLAVHVCLNSLDEPLYAVTNPKHQKEQRDRQYRERYAGACSTAILGDQGNEGEYQWDRGDDRSANSESLEGS
jgi:hypothetical protein